MLKKKSSVAKPQRRKLSPEFKAKVALAALKEDRTLADLCAEFKVHSTQISDWKRQLVEHAVAGFARKGSAERERAIDVTPLHAKIGELSIENDFLERALSKAGLLSAR
jgi:transposase